MSKDITVRLVGGQNSLDHLLKGVRSIETILRPNDDGTYTLTVEQKIGDIREMKGMRNAGDFLVDQINKLRESIEGVEMPEKFDQAWAEMEREWDEFNGKTALGHMEESK